MRVQLRETLAAGGHFPGLRLVEEESHHKEPVIIPSYDMWFLTGFARSFQQRFMQRKGMAFACNFTLFPEESRLIMTITSLASFSRLRVAVPVVPLLLMASSAWF